MTFNVQILVSGKPMGGIKVACNCFDSGQTFYRFTDGNGYCGIGVPADPQDGLLFVDDQRVVGEDKEPWKQYVTIGSTDQAVSIALIPFEQGGSVPTPSPVVWPIHRDGLVLREADGKIFRWLGLDGFRFYIMWLRGQKSELESLIRGYLKVCPGTTMFRVFGMLNSFDHIYPQEWPNYYDELTLFADFMLSFGLGIEFTVFADAGIVMPDRNERNQHRDRVRLEFQDFESPNVLVEVANEPSANQNLPGGDQEAHEHAVALMGHGFLVASGCSNEEAIAAGYAQADYVTIHPPRDDQWYRKLKDVLDVRDQTKCPTVADEPIGIAEQDKPGSRTTNADECATAGAIAQLHGLGSTIHGDFGINAAPFGPNQEKAAKAWHDAALWVPVDAQLARFTRGTLDAPCKWTYAPGDAPSPCEHLDDLDLRSYGKQVGDLTYVVQCHVPGQNYRSAIQPCAGWVVDALGPSAGLASLKQE